MCELNTEAAVAIVMALVAMVVVACAWIIGKVIK
jgi:hypothetical protein